MKRITMNIGTHGVQTTAAEMRRRLAQALSKIPGDQIVFFNLTLHLGNYQPPALPPYGRLPGEYSGNVSALRETPTIVYGELARPENE